MLSVDVVHCIAPGSSLTHFCYGSSVHQAITQSVSVYGLCTPDVLQRGLFLQSNENIGLFLLQLG